jgi:CubicO group peptidase (beta-lactamase class C family)
MSRSQSHGIAGHCDAAFTLVREAMADNLADPRSVGESVAVVLDGRLVVDLWGGARDAVGTPWAQDTLVCMFSVGKAIAALAVWLLVQRGRIEIDRPVAHYWPEYAQAGKADTTVAQLLAHMAGIPGAFAAARGDAYDWAAMVRAIERQEPLWPPGSVGCYHTFTYGHLTGELVRRVDGRGIGQFVREEIARPLGVSYGFGLTPAEQARCADIVYAPSNPNLGWLTDPDTLLGRCWVPLPYGDEEDFNTARCRTAEMPAFNGHGTARAVAAIYGALAGAPLPDGTRLLDEACLDAALTEQWDAVDPLGLNYRMARGFKLSNSVTPFTGHPLSFGQNGLNGAVGFGERERRVGFCYAPNTVAPEAGPGPFVRHVCDALQASLAAL